MLSTERESFEAQLAVLFGGYPTFLTPPRVEAYWRGLQKMPLSVFVRCIDQVLGESGHDKLPTVNTIWQTSRMLRSPAQTHTQEKPRQSYDNFHLFGNHLLMNFLRRHPQPVSDESLKELVKAKDRIVADYRSIHAEDPVTAEEVRDALNAKWNELVKKPASEAEMQENRDYVERHFHVKDRWANA